MSALIKAPPQDHFVYPEASGYAGIVDAVAGLTTPDTWRREVSSLYRSACPGNPTYRLYMRELLFPGRCAICRKNNKSLSHCMIGQGAKNAASAESVDPNTLDKIQKIVYLSQMMGQEFAERQGSQDSAAVFVFPHETDIADPKKLHRVSEQHSFPSIDPLLRQEPFATYFAPEMFAEFFNRFTTGPPRGRGIKKQAEWAEPEAKLRERQEGFKVALAHPEESERRRLVATAISNTYIALLGAHCTAQCAVKNKIRKDFVRTHALCKTCEVLRRTLKKQYIEMMTSTVNKIVNKLFATRQPPFAGCPTSFTGARFVDAQCRVERIHEASLNR